MENLERYQRQQIESQLVMTGVEAKCQMLTNTISILIPAIKIWVENTGDNMHEIKKDRLYHEIVAARKQLANAKSNAALTKTISQTVGRESGIHSNDQSKRDEAQYEQNERNHNSTVKQSEIISQINQLNTAYYNTDPDAIFDGYFFNDPNNITI